MFMIQSFFSKKYHFLILLFFLILLSKVIFIWNYGSNVPFWDQWDAEALNLYKPLEEGRLTWRWLFAAHNEHHIFFTKLLSLFIYWLFDGWYPICQIYINAFIHSISILIFFLLIVNRIEKDKKFAVFCVFSLIIFIVPLGYENLLSGFQSQFYFVSLFGFAAIYFLLEKKEWSFFWFLGVLFLLCSFFSLAGGLVFCLAISITYLFLFFIENHQSKYLILFGIFSIMFFLEYILTPHIIPHDDIKSSTISSFFSAYNYWSAWPLKFSFGGLFIYFPSLYFIYKLFKKNVNETNKKFYLGLIFWGFCQIASIAYSRGEIALSVDGGSRYLDLISFSIIVNIVIILTVFPVKTQFVSSIVWGAIVLTGILLNVNDVNYQLKLRYNQSIKQEANLKCFLKTGDTSCIYNKKIKEIPYPWASKLERLLRDTTIKKIVNNTMELK